MQRLIKIAIQLKIILTVRWNIKKIARSIIFAFLVLRYKDTYILKYLDIKIQVVLYTNI